MKDEISMRETQVTEHYPRKHAFHDGIPGVLSLLDYPFIS